MEVTFGCEAGKSMFSWNALTHVELPGGRSMQVACWSRYSNCPWVHVSSGYKATPNLDAASSPGSTEPALTTPLPAILASFI